MDDPAVRAANDAARTSYGKLLAILSSRTGDIAAAEDALADAFAKALKTWPETGVPANPDAWLITTARNALTDHQRRMTRMDITDTLPETAMEAPVDTPDPRLGLLFVCAHPTIDAGIHTPLMLQTVLGIDAADIARAFATSPTAMAQRLVRAKRKIKDTRVPFTVPDSIHWPNRLPAVLEGIYGAASVDWLMAGDDLGAEAHFLSHILIKELPDEAEALGLAALIGFNLSRRTARMVDGIFIPLHDQDTSLWDSDLITHSAHLLTRARKQNQIGRFQLEAAISSVHAHRKSTGDTNWRALEQLYTGLMSIAPTLGTAVARAAAIGQAHRPQDGLAALNALDPDMTQAFQPFHATRAHLLHGDDPQGAAARLYQGN